jgi:IS605 OrfB family transposase
MKKSNQRKDFLHKLSNQITDENQVIVIETLRSSNMMKNHKLAKAIGDVSWSEFCRQLAYKAEWKGRTLIKADRFYPSSQICSACGHRDGKKAPHIRDWTCPACGATPRPGHQCQQEPLGFGQVKENYMRQGLPFEPTHIHSLCLQRHTQVRKEFVGSFAT